MSGNLTAMEIVELGDYRALISEYVIGFPLLIAAAGWSLAKLLRTLIVVGIGRVGTPRGSAAD